MRLLFLAVLLAASNAPALATDVGVSVSIGQPGFYGRLDFGDYPPPRLLYQQPRIVNWVPEGGPPVYLNVPAKHVRNWRRHCIEYNACDERVYFVQNDWYEREYAPRYQRRHDNRGNDNRGNDRRGNDNHRYDPPGQHEDGKNDRGRNH